MAIAPSWLITQEIDVLLINDPMPGAFGFDVTDSSKAAAHLDAVSGLPVLSDSSAVRNNRVFVLGGNMVGSPLFIIGYAYMAKWFHPDLFKDFHPRALHQEYLTRFMQVDIDLSNQGLFIYPEE
jgi:iron complex transport system substrate-binding protein